MDRVPLYRHPLFVALVSLGIFAALYYWLLGAAGGAAIPTSVFSDLILIFGIFLLLAAIVFTLNLLMTSASNSKIAVSIFLRLILLLTMLLAHIPLFMPGGTEMLLRAILIDADFMLILLAVCLPFTAQFILPVESPDERAAAVRRLFGHVLGERGPITFVKDGKAVEAHDDSKRLGPGVFLVDHASAIVLRTDVQFTRAVGPGVVFTGPGERIAEALDLRRQVRTVPGEIPATGQSTEPGAVTSLALTRDGIPVSADLNVTFMLHPGHTGKPREGDDPKLSPYEFSNKSAERAVFGHLYGDTGDKPWSDLPILFVTDLWREEIKSLQLSALISYVQDAPPPLERVRKSILRKLTMEPFDDSTGSDQLEAFREAEILRARGIRVLDVSITKLQLPADVRREQNLRWQQRWSGAVQAMLSDAMEKVRLERQQGQEDADELLLKELTRTLSEILAEGRAPGKRDSIGMVIADAARFAAQENIVVESAALSTQLSELRDAIAAMDAECREAGGHGQA